MSFMQRPEAESLHDEWTARKTIKQVVRARPFYASVMDRRYAYSSRRAIEVAKR